MERIRYKTLEKKKKHKIQLRRSQRSLFTDHWSPLGHSDAVVVTVYKPTLIKHGQAMLSDNIRSSKLAVGISMIRPQIACATSCKQEAQLSQRGRAMLRIVTNFLRSFEITPKSRARVWGHNQLSAVGLNMSTLYRHWHIQRRILSCSDLEVWLRDRSRSLNMQGTVRKHGHDFLFAFHSNYGHIFNRFVTIHERDNQQPSQTDAAPRQRPHLCTASCGEKLK